MSSSYPMIKQNMSSLMVVLHLYGSWVGGATSAQFWDVLYLSRD